MNVIHRTHYFLMLATLLGCGGLLLVSCSSFNGTTMVAPAVEGAAFVGNNACLDCHKQFTRVFAFTPHSRVHLADTSVPGSTGCESCHGPGSKHVEAGGGRGRFIVNPGKDATTCLNCHIDTHAQFNLPQHHPLLEGKMNCVQCHDPHGIDIMKPARGLAMSRQNEQCAQCHREQARPFAFIHEALRDGCTTCHQPHGGVNSKMLVVADNNLCLRCHAQRAGSAVAAGAIYIGHEDHTAHLRLGGCYTAGCHTAVHGSNIDPHLRY